MPLKKLKCGGYLLVRPTASELALFRSRAKPVAISGRAMQSLSRSQYARIEVQAEGREQQEPEDQDRTS
jgi:hypothetical protein